MIRVLLSVFICISTSVWGDSLPKLDVVTDLSTDSVKMSAEKLPMVVEMAAKHCSYCKLIEEHVLVPMIISGDYESKALIRQVDIEENTFFIDFNGETITQKGFAKRYEVNLTPTVLFLNHKGEEIAPRMTGVSLIDYYGLYLDEAIEIAQTEIKKRQ